MIPIQIQKFRIGIDDRKVINEKMTAETCKTNLNPQLIFNQQSFTGHTTKTFVGNWTENGFWISKYRLQLFNLRPDIIARFDFSDSHDHSIAVIRYSIGFSSIFIGLTYTGLISFLLAYGGLVALPFGLAMMVGFYTVLSVTELKHVRKAIFEKLLNQVDKEIVDEQMISHTKAP